MAGPRPQRARRITTFEDAPGGGTLYRAVAKHKNAEDRDTHAEMGFHDGWGTVATQLGEVAAGPREKA